jgi:hypothetical protein
MKKLTDLEPRWIEKDGQKVAIVFRCPCCDKNWWISCGFAHMKISEQMDLFIDQMKEEDKEVIPFNQAGNWKIVGNYDFNTLTIQPSLNAEAAGHWHGFVKDGYLTAT